MKIFLVLGLMTALSGCAVDDYSGGDKIAMTSVLGACKKVATDEYIQSHKYIPTTGDLLVGAATGAAGGFIIGASSPGMASSDIDPAIEHCMAEHGYIGTSEN